MNVKIQEANFDPGAEISAYEKENLKAGKHGGYVSFVGTMRDYNDGYDVNTMWLDHYPGMTEKEIEKVCKEAIDRWDILDAYVVHRVGEILPSDAIVLVVVWSAHRRDSFDACRYIINYLKQSAPFWKREKTDEGEQRWVEHNTVDPGVADKHQLKDEATTS